MIERFERLCKVFSDKIPHELIETYNRTFGSKDMRIWAVFNVHTYKHGILKNADHRFVMYAVSNPSDVEWIEHADAGLMLKVYDYADDGLRQKISECVSSKMDTVSGLKHLVRMGNRSFVSRVLCSLEPGKYREIMLASSSRSFFETFLKIVKFVPEKKLVEISSVVFWNGGIPDEYMEILRDTIKDRSVLNLNERWKRYFDVRTMSREDADSLPYKTWAEICSYLSDSEKEILSRQPNLRGIIDVFIDDAEHHDGCDESSFKNKSRHWRMSSNIMRKVKYALYHGEHLDQISVPNQMKDCKRFIRGLRCGNYAVLTVPECGHMCHVHCFTQYRSDFTTCPRCSEKRKPIESVIFDGKLLELKPLVSFPVDMRREVKTRNNEKKNRV